MANDLSVLLVIGDGNAAIAIKNIIRQGFVEHVENAPVQRKNLVDVFGTSQLECLRSVLAGNTICPCSVNGRDLNIGERLGRNRQEISDAAAAGLGGGHAADQSNHERGENQPSPAAKNVHGAVEQHHAAQKSDRCAAQAEQQDGRRERFCVAVCKKQLADAAEKCDSGNRNKNGVNRAQKAVGDRFSAAFKPPTAIEQPRKRKQAKADRAERKRVIQRCLLTVQKK